MKRTEKKGYEYYKEIKIKINAKSEYPKLYF